LATGAFVGVPACFFNGVEFDHFLCGRSFFVVCQPRFRKKRLLRSPADH
jgi:hypothetical protein